MKIKKPIEKLITLLIIGLIAFLMYVLDIGCFFRFLFGVYCPGCGMTRAALSLLRLDAESAFRYNPMVWSLPLLLAFYLFDGKMFKAAWINRLLVGGVLIGFVVCWIVRLMTGAILFLD